LDKKVNHSVFIIAEAGVNHNGSLETAFEMIPIAKNAGADAIKFQTAIPELTMTKDARKAEYQLQTTKKNESQLEMVKRILLPLDAFSKLKLHCEQNDIEFMSTAFDHVSIETLEALGLKRYKIPSGEITNLPYLQRIGSIGKPIVMSTGMATLEEVRKAMNILVESGTKKECITVLHCNTEYPTPFRDVNLHAMLTIKEKFQVEVGYSDHSIGIEVAIAAVALGARIIEKHFTLDRKMEGPDHQASAEPQELKAMVKAIRNIEKAMGDGIKRASSSEEKNIVVARKSIVAACKIKKGEIFSEDNLTAKRPATGVSPMKWDQFIGKPAQQDYDVDDLVKL